MATLVWVSLAVAALAVVGGLAGSVCRAAGRATAPAKPVYVDLEVLRMIESGGNDHAVSPAGAKGPYQITRVAWTDAVRSIQASREDVADRPGMLDYDLWVENRAVSEAIAHEYINHVLPRYLTARQLHRGDTTGPVPDSLEARLAAYNAGAMRVRQAYEKSRANWIAHLPLETRDYLSRYERAATQRREAVRTAD